MINIVGLGSTDSKGLTLEAVNTIKNGNKNFIRTIEHGAVAYFDENKIEYSSFDYLYENSESFEKVYESIVEILLEESKNQDINYFVPGNPLVAESSVVKLIEKTEDINIVMGMSFIEPMLRAVKRDPSKGMILIDGDDFDPLDINVDCDVIITQIYNHRIAVDLKLSLSEIYSDEYMIYLVIDAGLTTEVVHYIPIYELDRIDGINHQSALYIPRCKDITNLKKIINALEDDIEFYDEEDVDVIIDEVIDDLKKLVSINSEGTYYYYELLDKIYKKITVNSDLIKNTMEKS